MNTNEARRMNNVVKWCEKIYEHAQTVDIDNSKKWWEDMWKKEMEKV